MNAITFIQQAKFHIQKLTPLYGFRFEEGSNFLRCTSPKVTIEIWLDRLTDVDVYVSKTGCKKQVCLQNAIQFLNENVGLDLPTHRWQVSGETSMQCVLISLRELILTVLDDRYIDLLDEMYAYQEQRQREFQDAFEVKKTLNALNESWSRKDYQQFCQQYEQYLQATKKLAIPPSEMQRKRFEYSKGNLHS
jgi:hypothetical protein